MIRWYEEGKIELYNLAQDIEEQNDLVEEMPEIANRLEDLLDIWLNQVKAQMNE